MEVHIYDDYTQLCSTDDPVVKYSQPAGEPVAARDSALTWKFPPLVRAQNWSNISKSSADLAGGYCLITNVPRCRFLKHAAFTSELQRPRN